MGSQTAGVAALLSSLALASLAAASVALAQSVPMPVPAPQPKSYGPPSAPRPPAATAPAPAAQQPAKPPEQTSSGFPSFFKPPAIFGKSGETTAFDAKQRALADRVSTYLSSIRQLHGNFVQVAPDGSKSEGEFFLQKPGKVRFDYDSPSRIDIIADGSSVVVRDRKLATQDVYPLSQTPLRFLLADRIDLLKDATVTAVSADDTYVTVLVEEKHAVIGTSKLMMMFGAKDFQLKQWIVTDPQGYDTTVALSNLDTAKRPDPDMFRIDYTQYPN